MMMTSSKCRPRKSAGRLWVPVSRYQIHPRASATDPDDGRVLVSRDVTTIPQHFAEFVATRSSPGIILIPPQIAIGRSDRETAHYVVERRDIRDQNGTLALSPPRSDKENQKQQSNTASHGLIIALPLPIKL